MREDDTLTPASRQPPAAAPLRAALERAAALLSEPVMGFLALALLVIEVGTSLFPLSPLEAELAHGAEWAIVLLFALELLLQLALAPDRAAFLRRPRTLLDAALVVLPLLTLVPLVPEALRTTPALRLARLFRVAAVGMRASGGAGRRAARAAAATAIPPLEASVLSAARPDRLLPLSWDDLVREIRTPDEALLVVSGIRPEDHARISLALGFPASILTPLLAETAFPRLDLVEGFLTLFVWFPVLEEERAGALYSSARRVGTLFVGTERSLVALSRERSPAMARVVERLAASEPGEPFFARVLTALVQELLSRYDAALGAFEEEVSALEDLPAEEPGKGFLERAFQLKRRLARLEATLRRVREALRSLRRAKVPLRGLGEPPRTRFEILAEEAEVLAERAARTGEDLVSVIEMHLNVVSYQMNRVMRVLAVVTTLALFPTVVGGLLGMNLAESPWRPSLGQVAFGVGAGMSLSLYAFAVKGWLR